MPKIAKLYIAAVATVGLSILVLAVLQWKYSNVPHYCTYLTAALVASTLKVRLPGVRSTVTPCFLFILIGVADFTLPETLVMAGLGGGIQCLWRPKRRPTAAQVLFNIGTLAITAALAHWGPHHLIIGSMPLLLAVGVGIFYLTNTALVTLVVALTETKPLRKVWDLCHLWSFPYYLLGGGMAALISLAGRTAGWKAPLLVLPLVYLAYQYYRLCVQKAVPPAKAPSSAEALAMATVSR